VDTIRRQARVAGLLYFLAGITAPFSLIYVQRTLIVPGDATATADHVRASGTLLRLGMESEMITAVMFVFVVLALCRLFKEVSHTHAAAMAILMLVSVPISMANVLNDAAALILAGGAGYLSVFGKGQLDALVLLFLRLHGNGLFVAEIFWGLWLFPFGTLVIRSGFIPRALGVLLMIAGFGYVASAVTALLLPQYSHGVGQVAMMLQVGEVPIVFWLLIWGAKEQRVMAPTS